MGAHRPDRHGVPRSGGRARRNGGAAHGDAGCGGAGLDRSRNRVLALPKLQQAGRVERLPHQLPGGQFRSLALARIAALQNGASTQTRALTTGVDPAVFTEVGSQLSEDQSASTATSAGHPAPPHRRSASTTRRAARSIPTRATFSNAGRPRAASGERLPEQASVQGAGRRAPSRARRSRR